MEYKVRKFQTPSGTLQYFANLNAEAREKNSAPEERVRRAFDLKKDQEEHNTPELRTDRNGVVSVDYENQGDYVPTTTHKIGTALQDTGTQLLHGVQTLGSSVIGDVTRGFSPNAANWLERNTFGIINQTPQSKLDANRQGNNRWNSRISDSANAVSTALTMPMAGKVMGMGGRKISQSKPIQRIAKGKLNLTPKDSRFLVNQEGFVAPSIKQVNPSHKEALLYNPPAQTYDYSGDPELLKRINFKAHDYSGNPELLKGINFKKSLHNLENSVKVANPHIFTNDFRIPSKYYKIMADLKKNIKPLESGKIDLNNLLNSKASKKDLYVSPMGDLFNIPNWRVSLDNKINAAGAKYLKPYRARRLDKLHQGSLEKQMNNIGEEYLNIATNPIAKFKNWKLKKRYGIDLNLAAKETKLKWQSLKDSEGISNFIQNVPEKHYINNYRKNSGGMFTPRGSYIFNNRLYRDNLGDALSTRHWSVLGGIPNYQTINPHSRVVIPYRVSGNVAQRVPEHELRHAIDSGILQRISKSSKFIRDIANIMHDRPTRIVVKGSKPTYNSASNTYNVPTMDRDFWPKDISSKPFIKNSASLSDHEKYLRNPWEFTAYLNTNLKRDLVNEGIIASPNSPISKRAMRWAVDNADRNTLGLYKQEIKDFNQLRKMLNRLSF